MEAALDITVHRSQWPVARRAALDTCIRRRRMDARFHYESTEQIAAWLDVHESHSPARSDPAVSRLYADAVAASDAGGHRPTCLASVGCGYGHKDLDSLRAVGAGAYAAIDAGAGMVAQAMARIKTALPGIAVRGLVADVADAEGMAAWLRAAFPGQKSVLWLAFGIVPNIPAPEIPAVLRALIQSPGDGILVGANLIPGQDPPAEMAAILPQYDNPATRRWLSLLPQSLGIPIGPDDIRYEVLPPAHGHPWRIRASASIKDACVLAPSGEPEAMRAGENLELFFSNRFTPGDIATVAEAAAMHVERSHIAPDCNEGVFEISL